MNRIGVSLVTIENRPSSYHTKMYAFTISLMHVTFSKKVCSKIYFSCNGDCIGLINLEEIRIVFTY